MNNNNEELNFDAQKNTKEQSYDEMYNPDTEMSIEEELEGKKEIKVQEPEKVELVTSEITVKDETKTDLALPQMNVVGVQEFYDHVKYIVETFMIEGTDYGKFGKMKENTLLKPGADMLCTIANLLDLYSEPIVVVFGGGHKSFEYNCYLKDGEKTLITGNAECSTMETNYSYQSYYENGKYAGKEEIPKENIPDKIHTVKQMAKKRAKVDACNKFFNPARFFPGAPGNGIAPKEKPPKQKPESRWFPNNTEVKSLDWFETQMGLIKDEEILLQFIDEFAMDIRLFVEKDQEILRTVFKTRRNEIRAGK